MNSRLLQLLLLFGLLLASAACADEVTLRWGGEWDSNVSDNFTEVSGWRMAPELELQVAHKFSRRLSGEVSTRWSGEWSRAGEERSALLQSPRHTEGVGLKAKLPAGFTLTAAGQLSEWMLEKSTVTKRLWRGQVAAARQWESWRVDLGYTRDGENYGEDAQDGATHWFDGKVRYRLPEVVLGRFDLLVKGQREDRGSRRGIYTYVKDRLGAGARWSHGDFSLEGSLARSWKEYAAHFAAPTTLDLVQKRNRYLDLDLKAGWSAGVWELSPTYAWSRVLSNEPGSSYRDRVYGLELGCSLALGHNNK